MMFDSSIMQMSFTTNLGVSLAALLGLALAILLLLLLLLLPYFFGYRKEEKDLKFPYGNMGWPLLGETLAFIKPHKSDTIGTFLQQHVSRYGRVFKSHLFGKPTIVSTDLELNNFILQNEDKLFEGCYPKSVQDVLGKLSMMLVSGDIHKKLRTVSVSFIGSSKTSPNFLSLVEKMSISVMNSWKDCDEISFAKEAKKFTLSVMLKTLLSIEPGEPIALQMLEDYLTYMKGLVSIPLRLPGTPFTKALKASTRISSTIKGIIKEREKKEDVGIARGDFLDEMLLKGDLTNTEEQVSVVMDLLFAGYETTAGLLTLLLYYLALTPQALQELKEEHLAIRRRKKDGEPLTWTDIMQLQFTSNVINEALRCGNLVKFLHRRALEDVEFKGYNIRAGWQVLPVFTAVHLDPHLHHNPSEFYPWRWNDQLMRKKVTPFGGGMRLCPGADLAKYEASIFLHHVVLNYRWEMKEDDYPLSHPYMEFKKGLRLKVEAIKGKS